MASVATRVANHRARKAVDTTPADLAARFRAERPTPPDAIDRMSADVKALSEARDVAFHELRAVVQDLQTKQDENGQILPSDRKRLADAERAVEEIEARRNALRVERDRTAMAFHASETLPHAKRGLVEVTAALHDTVSALGAGLAAAGLDADVYRQICQTLLFSPIPPEAPDASVDIEETHGHAVVLRDALKQLDLLSREAGGLLFFALNAGIVALADRLVDQVATARLGRRA